MKRKLNKKELEKVSGGTMKPAPTFSEQQGGQDTNQNGEEEKGKAPKIFPMGERSDTNQQSEGNPEGLPLPQ